MTNQEKKLVVEALGDLAICVKLAATTLKPIDQEAYRFVQDTLRSAERAIHALNTGIIPPELKAED